MPLNPGAIEKDIEAISWMLDKIKDTVGCITEQSADTHNLGQSIAENLGDVKGRLSAVLSSVSHCCYGSTFSNSEFDFEVCKSNLFYWYILTFAPCVASRNDFSVLR